MLASLLIIIMGLLCLHVALLVAGLVANEKYITGQQKIVRILLRNPGFTYGNDSGIRFMKAEIFFIVGVVPGIIWGVPGVTASVLLTLLMSLLLVLIGLVTTETSAR